MAVFTTPETKKLPVFLDDANAPRHPRLSKFRLAVGKRTVRILATVDAEMPTVPRLPVEAFALVMPLLPTTKTRDLRA